MADSVSMSLLPQYVEATDEKYNGRSLHKVQQAMLHYDDLPQFTIITAPTGTGKSFAFPLPIISYKQKNIGKFSKFSERRGIIVSPTNALIKDMETQYKKNFPELKVTRLNREKLDEYGAKGPARWDALLQELTDNQIIITNPDILNFALFGGYARYSGQHEVTQLFARASYFVFDEYHLYDEEQIANIISWIIFSRMMMQKETKFIFASATAEKGLVDVLIQQGFDPKEIKEEIISEQQETAARKIHGQIDVTFLSGTNPQEYLLQNAGQIRDWMLQGKRVLVIFDSMKELRQARQNIERKFDDWAVAEESGYFTKSKIREDTTNAHLIIGTNKVEVGVNLDVTICLMQTGKHFANFIQRFGRVAREGKDGKVIVFIESGITKIQREFTGEALISYYDFIEKCRKIDLLSERDFYSEKVPLYLGTYFYVIAKSLKDYNTKKLFRSRLKLKDRTKYMYSLMRKIDRGLQRLERQSSGYKNEYECWEQWWGIFTNTFKFFRNPLPVVQVQDLELPKDRQYTCYSLEWILRNRAVSEIKEINSEKCYVVLDFLETPNELQYCVESMPIYTLSAQTMYLQQSERYRLKKAFNDRINEIAVSYNGSDSFRQTARQLLEDVRKLKPVFTEKRLAIKSIESYSNII